MGIGFSITDEVTYSPLMKSVSYLEFVDLNRLETKSSVIDSNEAKDIEKVLEDHTKRIEKEYGVDYKKSDLYVVAMDEESFVGGLHGVLYEDHLYISLLVVNESYRGKDIGSTLMKMVEKEVDNTSVKSISLGTTAFQAKGFYEKLGYKLIMTQYNLPKGYECYTLIKDL